MWFKPQEENFLFWISVESEFSVATKVSCALGGNLMEAFLNLNDSEMFNFLLATYARTSSCFSLSILYKASWFVEVAHGCERRNKISSVTLWFCSSQLILWVISVCNSVEIALFHREVSVWFHVMVGTKPEVPYIDVTCMWTVDLVGRVLVSNGSAGILPREARPSCRWTQVDT